ncbi:HAD-IIA family hydrolase [Sphingomonas psychrotolerans]|uniref:Haloacid dehalogenase n=1 Tax=Sphingomonas psychrotolerans TaxID=1327635 RepID=A0A2K8MJZ1_9SPHN|nr:HAD hydrolase-like protein [Sphingomonas psychrotolerans]ATY34187.1 haloacid dehalogenase [Sphingomonas psychrotolerans]
MPASWTELCAAAGRAEAVLCDWDGCLALGSRLHPGAVAFLRRVGRIAIVSNNSTMTRAECRGQLVAAGIAVASDDIHLAGDVLLREAARQFAGRPVTLVAGPAMRREAERLGLCLQGRDAAAVLVLRDPGFDFATLCRAANQVRDGAAYWIANPDNMHPVANGIAPETGALAASITAAAGRRPDRIIGKPHALLFNRAMTGLDLQPEALLMIGDNPDTDVKGANALAIHALLVGRTTWKQSPGARLCDRDAETG